MAGRRRVRGRSGLAGVLALFVLALPGEALAQSTTPGTSPPITIPHVQDLLGTAQNSGDSIGAVLTGLGSQGGGNGSGSGGSGTGGGGGGGGSTEPPITNPTSCTTLEEFLNPPPGTHCGTNQPTLNPTGTPPTTTPGG